MAYLSAPLFDGSGGTNGAIALIARVKDQIEATNRLGLLESVCRYASLAAELTIRQSAPQPSMPGSSSAPMIRHSATTLNELAFAITNDLRNKTGCGQIALGWVRGSHVDILSISGLDEVRRNSPGITSLRGAMEECLDNGGLLVCQRDDPWAKDDVSRHRLHLQWHRDTKGDAVASLPLRHCERTVAVLSVRRGSDRPFSRDELERIRGVLESSIVGAMVFAGVAGRSLWKHFLASLRNSGRVVTSSKWVGPKTVVTGVLAALSYLTFGTLPYRVTVPCTTAPAEVRQLSAPFEAPLLSGTIVEGDVVQKGEVLCEFDRQDLLHQQAELQAQLAVQEREQDRALANGTPHEAQLSMANQVLTKERLAIVNRRLEQAVIRAPFHGIVVAGDLRQRIGTVLPRGEPLYRIAPNDHWSIELEVPEIHVAQLEKGMHGAFSTYSQPDLVYPISVRRIRGSSGIRNGRNIFVAEAVLQSAAPPSAQASRGASRSSPILRPGIQGVAAVDVGRRPIWWVLSHRLLDYVRLNLWL